MSFVPTISSISNINNNGVESRSSHTPLESVVLGETLEATVLEKLAGNKYTVALKNAHIPATSNSSLNIGEKLTVKVNSLHPQIVLNVIGSNSSSGNAAVHENLLQWRANPEALVQVAGKFAGIARLLKNIDLSETFLEGDVKKLIKLFDDIILSRQTKANRLFLKDFTSRTGLLPESSLKQTVKDSSPKGISKPFDDNLKALLLKLTEAANDILRGDPQPDLELKLKLNNIMAFAGEALKAIEVSQVINSVFQESDNGLVLQIPVALADGFRLADIFITPDGRDEQGKKNFASCSVALFLDLDILGKIAANANFREGSINCVIRCEREEIRNLIADNLDELKNALTQTGYQIGYIDCVQEEGLTEGREEFLARQSFFVDQLVNLFA
ncbi:MAG: flagellar hook-length control protein FliK [Smithellaceae bacterium]